MNHKKIVLIVFLFMLYQQTFTQEKPVFLIRCDDVGMNHATNLAVKEMLETGYPFSASVMTCCPWFEEAAELLKNQPHVSIGVHLTLNAEFCNYRWGPVCGVGAVPSLVNEKGFFPFSIQSFLAQKPNINEVEKELRAQIDQAFNFGLKPVYLDFHMGTAQSTPEMQQLTIKLAQEYELGISGYFGEQLFHLFNIAPENKTTALLEEVSSMKNGEIYYAFFHIGKHTPEMQALQDMNMIAGGIFFSVSKHRQAELEALMSSDFSEGIEKKNVRLMNYKMLITELGLENLQPAKKY